MTSLESTSISLPQANHEDTQDQLGENYETLLSAINATLRQAGILHGRLHIHSTSAHNVFTDGSIVVKTSRQNSPIAACVEREFTILTALGLYNARGMRLLDNRFILITDHNGITPDIRTITPEVALQWAKAVNAVHQSSPPSSVALHSLNRDIFLKTQADKYASLEYGKLRTMATACSVALMKNLPRYAPGDPVLTHGDPKLQNTVLKNRQLSLIDWENCARGPKEADLALIVLNCYVEGRPDLWNIIKPLFSPINPAAFDWLFRANLANSIAYCAWKKEPHEVAKRLNLYETYRAHGITPFLNS